MSASCDQARGWIAVAIDGDLATAEANALATHVGTCSECSTAFRAEVASHRRLLEAAALDRLAAPARLAPQPSHKRRTVRVRTRPWWWVAAPLAAVLAIGTCLMFVQRPGTKPSGIATITATDASAVLVHDGQTISAVLGAAIADGDRLRGTLSFTLIGEETRIEATSCDLALAIEGRHKRWELRSGTIAAAVEHQLADGGLTVSTPLAIAEVVGTRFTLSADIGRSTLAVSDGRVRFARRSDGSESRMVEAGQSATISAQAAPAPSVRPIDDFEGPLRWTLSPDAAPMTFTAVASDHGHALHISYQPHPGDSDTFAQIARPFAFAPGDRAIRLRIHVGSAEPTASLNLQVRQRDRSCWMIGECSFADLHAGWNDVELPLPAAPRRCTDDSFPYDPTAVAELLLSVCTGATTCDLDDLTIVGPPPPRP